MRASVINKRLNTNHKRNQGLATLNFLINLKHRTRLNKVVRIDDVRFDFNEKNVLSGIKVYIPCQIRKEIGQLNKS